MRRMIDPSQLKDIGGGGGTVFKSITEDVNGNVKISKDLEVAGKLTINSTSELITKDGSSFGGGSGSTTKLYQHNVVLHSANDKSYLYITIINTDQTKFNTVSFFNYFTNILANETTILATGVLDGFRGATGTVMSVENWTTNTIHIRYFNSSFGWTNVQTTLGDSDGLGVKKDYVIALN